MRSSPRCYSWSFLRRDSPPIPRSTDKNTIVLADFANATGDPAFDGTLRQTMAVELANSPNFSVLSDARVSGTLGLMVRPSDTKLTPEVAAEICERTGSSAVVEGSITRLGSDYVLGLLSRNCQTGEVLDEEQASAAQKRRRRQGARPNGKPVPYPGRPIASARGKGTQLPARQPRPRLRPGSLTALQ